MLEAEAAKEAARRMAELANYGALGLCLMLALVAIVFLYVDGKRQIAALQKRLQEEQNARVEDAKAYMELALELQQREAGKIEKLEAIASVLKGK